MILRPSKQGKYQVVGEAYCHGFMYGEALLGPLPNEIELVLPENSTFPSYLDRIQDIISNKDTRLNYSIPLPNGWVKLES